MPTATPEAKNSWRSSRRCGTAGRRMRSSTTGRAGSTPDASASDRSIIAAIFIRSPGRSTCRAARRAGRCWCRRARPIRADASPPGARRHFVTAGTPEQIADLIEDWFSDGAADGFNIMPPLLPTQLEVFSTEVIPILQRRGLFRTEYEGTTLREHYGLPLPASVFDDPSWVPELTEAVAGV